MVKILVTDNVSEEGVQVFQALQDAEIVVRNQLTQDELKVEIRDVDALIVRSQTYVTGELLEAAHHLRVVGRAGVGVDNIDIAAATRKGVLVVNAPDGNTISAAEHTCAMLLALARHIPQAHLALHNGKWDRKKYVGIEVRNKTLAVLGMGRIGAEVAKRAKAFGMRVISYDPFLTPERASKLGVEAVSLDDALSRADFITVHTPLTKETRHLLNRDRFSRVKHGVRIINCARGGIIDESALCEALETGIVAGCAFDVFEHEPLTEDNPLLQYPQVITTPHLGASTVEAQVNVAVDVAEEIVRILRGEPAQTAVNLPALSQRHSETLQPYMSLSEKLGLFVAQLGGSHIAKIEVSYQGEIAQQPVEALTRIFLKGLLGYHYGDTVNYVNALVFAEESGIDVKEVRHGKSGGYSTQMMIRLETKHETRQVAGVVFNGLGPKIVELDGYLIDAPIEGKMLVTRHADRPGVVGKIGTLLGDHGVNIAGMQVGRKESGGEAVMVLQVDKTIPESVVQTIEGVDGIQVARVVEL